MSDNKKYPTWIASEHPERRRLSKDEKYRQDAYDEFMSWSGEIPEGYHWNWEEACLEPDCATF